MKINFLFFIYILLTGSLAFYSSCAEPFPELPPETQSGMGSFGCLVNNELVYAWYNNINPDVNAKYDINTDQLQITARCQFGQQFFIMVNDPYKKQDTLIDTICYLPPNSNEWMEESKTGYFRITRIDNFNNGLDIVSGTFYFDLNENGKTSIHVTKGRFDLNLYIH